MISFPRKKSKKYKDNRCRRTIKQALNKRFRNKSAVNNDIAKIISRFSHKTLFTSGSYLMTKDLNYFIILTLLSNHWVQGWYCPSQLQFANGIFYHIPNIFRKSLLKRKKIFEPFTDDPYIKHRKRKFFLQKKKRYEPMPTYTSVFNQLC